MQITVFPILPFLSLDNTSDRRFCPYAQVFVDLRNLYYGFAFKFIFTINAMKEGRCRKTKLWDVMKHQQYWKTSKNVLSFIRKNIISDYGTHLNRSSSDKVNAFTVDALSSSNENVKVMATRKTFTTVSQKLFSIAMHQLITMHL